MISQGGAIPNRFAVILAGGIGSRFWPASTRERPKQLLPLGSDRPLIADTVDRAIRIAGLERLLIVTGGGLVGPFAATVSELTDDNFLVEPIAKGTGPALAWAASEVLSRDPDAVMISLHADHVISPDAAFDETVERAIDAAADGRLYCIGIRPNRPETGYGYVRIGEAIAPGVHAVRRFVEKPDLDTARSFCDAGEYLWNSGIFVWRPADLLTAIRDHAPELAPGLERLQAGDVDGFFQRVRAISIDHGVMERAGSVGVVEASFEWDDVGSWNALARTRSTDERGNAVVGSARLVDASGSIVWAEDGDVTLFGVSDLVVVRSSGQTLVTTRQAAPDLKRLLSLIDNGNDA